MTRTHGAVGKFGKRDGVNRCGGKQTVVVKTRGTAEGYDDDRKKMMKHSVPATIKSESTKTQQRKLLNESARLKTVLG